MQTSPLDQFARWRSIRERLDRNPLLTYEAAEREYLVDMGFTPEQAQAMQERRVTQIKAQIDAGTYHPDGQDIAERLLQVVDTRPLCSEHLVPYDTRTGCSFCKTEAENGQAPYREDIREEEGMAAAQSDLSRPVDQLLTGGWSLPKPLVALVKRWWPWCVAGVLLALAAWKVVHP